MLKPIMLGVALFVAFAAGNIAANNRHASSAVAAEAGVPWGITAATVPGGCLYVATMQKALAFAPAPCP